MKSRHTLPLDVERIMKTDEYIISTADTHGRITSANDVFVEYSGYSRTELLHAQHNIVRHPDMPRSVFCLLWETLHDGEEFHGYIKNLGKDGSFYWVYAHVLPEYDGAGVIVGYRSIRRAPRRETIARVVELYAAMLTAENAVNIREAIPAGLAVLSQYLAAHGQSYEQMIATL